MRSPGANGGTWALGSSPERYWAWDPAGAGEGGGRVLPAQGAHGPMVEAAAIVPRVRVCWRMSVHRRLNRKHFHFFTLLSIMLGETPLSCPLAFLGGFHGFLSPLGARVV